jgi:hypothetical protein
MVFTQMPYRESLRDIETCLYGHSSKHYPFGIRGGIAWSTLADTNERRYLCIYQDFALGLILTARTLYAGDDFGLELKQTVYEFDLTNIYLFLVLCFPGRVFASTRALSN